MIPSLWLGNIWKIIWSERADEREDISTKREHFDDMASLFEPDSSRPERYNSSTSGNKIASLLRNFSATKIMQLLVDVSCLFAYDGSVSLSIMDFKSALELTDLLLLIRAWLRK